MSSSDHLPERGSNKSSSKRSRKNSDSGSNSSSKKSRNSINGGSKTENDTDDKKKNSKEVAEIWIYTKNLKVFEEARSSFEKSKKSFKGSACADLVSKASISVFRHWILVVKVRGKTLWMEANKIGDSLQSRNLDSEPEGVVEKCLIEKVYDESVSKLLSLLEESKHIVGKYSLKGANCQSWIKTILNELGLGGNLTIINDVMVELGSVAKNLLKLSAFASLSGFALAAGCKIASDLSSGSESVRMPKEPGSSRSSKS
ncbi:UNVERIFIED_CONTAM: hypothetical protein RMT77_013041 [Armadillidium vulgare]